MSLGVLLGPEQGFKSGNIEPQANIAWNPRHQLEPLNHPHVCQDIVLGASMFTYASWV